jgi:hypothetical protein
MNQPYARVLDAVVVEIWVPPADDLTPQDAFHPDFPGVWHACDSEVEPGFLLNGGVFNPPAAPVRTKAELIAYAADLRWRREQAGTIWNGWPIHTDDRSQGKILSELQAIAQGVRIDGDGWKFADGQFRSVANADFPALAIAAREHVRTVFGIEAGLLASIEAGTVTTTAEIDAAFEVAP